VAKTSVSTTAQSRAFKDKSRAAFDRQARDYDTAVSGRHARRLHGDVLAALDGFELGALLDVGCGTGLLLGRVRELRPAARLAGIDLSEAMLAVARRRLGDGADLRLADAEHLPQPDEAVDVVVCVDSFHHYPHPAAALSEMRRVTRPGGSLVLGE
jgi:ubiquinone/menaquinone biosynthesis C-methylase UbiE